MTRQEAVDILDDNFTTIDTHGHYTEDEEIEAVAMAIKELQKEPCEDAISRKWLLENQMVILSDGALLPVIRVLTVKHAPSVQPVADMPSVQPEQKTGHWVESVYRRGHYWCSECEGKHTDPEKGEWKETFDYTYAFCPLCGAKMVEPQESEDK